MVNPITAAVAKARARAEALEAAGDRIARLPLPAVEAAWAALPAFAPNRRHLARNRIVTLEASDAAMPFDMLRTRVMKELRSHGWRRVAVTSFDAGCGKSTVSANLAFSLARLPELRSVLIELDLRRPSLARLLGIANPPQLADVLKGEVPLTQTLVRLGRSPAVGVNVGPVRGATELLQGPHVAEQLAELERLLAPEVILFDLPPMLRGDDTIAFLDKVDCALMVVEAEVTPFQDIDSCEQDLARHSSVLGVVINKLHHVEATYGYG